jgi:protoporphyrinogen oxidase
MSNTLEFLRFPPLGIVDKLRLGATIFYASRLKDWKRLEAILVADWLRRWSGKRTFEKIWLPLLRAKLGENYRITSAAFIWATIARMYAARRTGLKKEMFGYVPGGYSRILSRFAETLQATGVKVKLSHVVKTAGNSGGELKLEFANGEKASFDQAVFTVPATVVAQVCADLTKEEKAKLKAIRYQGIICASLLLKRPLADFYVTNITDDQIPFTAVIEMSALVDREFFAGNSLVYLPKYLDPGDPAFAMSDQEVQDRFLDALGRMYPRFDRRDVVCFRISRVRNVFPLPTLHYSDNLPSSTTSVPGLHVLNSAHIVNGTLNVNEAVQLAETGVLQLLSAAASRSGGGPVAQFETALPIAV